MNVNAKINLPSQGGHPARSGRGRAMTLLFTSAATAAMWALPVQAARLAEPRVKSMSFAPEELELGATAIAVSERSEPLRLQFTDADFRRAPVTAAAEVSPRRGPIATSLDAAITVSTIQIWKFDQREKSVSDLATRIDATRRALAVLASQRTTLRSDNAQDAFNSALRGAEDAEQHLQQSLQAARSSSEQDWSRARSAVSADFALYADAVSQAETAMVTGSVEDSGKKLG